MQQSHKVILLLALLLAGMVFFVAREVRAPHDSEFLDTNDLESMEFTLTSPAFLSGELIPPQYTCDGDNVSPPLIIEGVPEEADSLVLLVTDPDIPTEVKEARGILQFDHWVVFDIPSITTDIESGAVPGKLGLNSAGETAYVGPCPPTQFEPTVHRYFFRLYAIKGSLEFDGTPSYEEVKVAAEVAAVGQAELMGRYERTVEESHSD
jgi:Raf kinase inhibitor-like YbhB/YbcL family protein